MNLANLLLKSARSQPERPAIAVGESVVSTYRDLASRVVRLSASLQGILSLKPGERVGLAMKNCPQYHEVLFACWHAGLVAVPMNAKLHPREFAYILENSGARLCFTSPDLTSSVPHPLEVASPDYAKLFEREGQGKGKNDVKEEPWPSKPDDPAWLFYTSGTTGVPKGAVLTHRNLLFQSMAYSADIDKLGPEDAILHAAPLSHGSGCYALPFFAAGGINVIPESGHFEAQEIFRLLEAWQNVSFFAAPTMVVRLLASPAARAPGGLKTLVYGGAPMYLADCLRAIELFGPRLYNLYGQGESPMTITGLSQAHHARREKLETCGVARTGVEVRIFDAQDRPLPPGEIGEIVTRSDCVMAGYWANPDATAKTLRGGWLHTGDVGSLDAEGFLTLRDRSKDMIISGGSNIYPREVEEVLLGHPAVAECSVVGRPHPEWGEEVVAFVVTRSPVTASELDEACKNNIARFKRPRHYRFVEALPKNNYGKVLKTELRKRLEK
ncbi:MAG TPA: long-chain fatty acid--CoA ligase [Burkholderiales bacterium]|nr:long-chain fatty acid--CoA ligase [Burkholderiales bacterium]